MVDLSHSQAGLTTAVVVTATSQTYKLRDNAASFQLGPYQGEPLTFIDLLPAGFPALIPFRRANDGNRSTR